MDTTPDTNRRGAPIRSLAWLAAAILFALPGLAMQLQVSGFDWTASDFVFWAVLLGGAGLLIELAVWVIRTPLYRLIAVAVVLGLALLIWADAAVGIF